jgi:hypothetical protein
MLLDNIYSKKASEDPNWISTTIGIHHDKLLWIDSNIQLFLFILFKSQ